MLYAIKADNEVVFVGCTDNPREAYAYHQEKMMEERVKDPCAPQDMYFMLSYWQETEHRRIHFVELDVGDEDEEVVRDILIRAIRPIGNKIDQEFWTMLV